MINHKIVNLKLSWSKNAMFVNIVRHLKRNTLYHYYALYSSSEGFVNDKSRYVSIYQGLRGIQF